MKLINMGHAGFTLTEMLASVLIMVIVVSIIGGGVIVVKDTYERITLQAEAQTLLSTTVSAVTDELRFAHNIKTENLTKNNNELREITFDSSMRGYRIYLDNDVDHMGNETGIYVGNVLEETTKNLPLLTAQTATSQLVSTIEFAGSEADYFKADGSLKDENDFVFDVTIHVVTNEKKEIAKQEIKIKPINVIS